MLCLSSNLVQLFELFKIIFSVTCNNGTRFDCYLCELEKLREF